MPKPTFDELARYGAAGSERRRRARAWCLGVAAVPLATGLVVVAASLLTAKAVGLVPDWWRWWAVVTAAAVLTLTAFGLGRWIDRKVRWPG